MAVAAGLSLERATSPKVREMASHTNRELSLMLAGAKPFAAFVLDGVLTEEQALSDQPFQRYVDAGRIVRREVPVVLSGLPMCRLLFALPGEEWRFDKYCALMESMSDGWNEDKERQEGALLGYTDEENDAHIERLRARWKP